MLKGWENSPGTSLRRKCGELTTHLQRSWACLERGVAKRRLRPSPALFLMSRSCPSAIRENLVVARSFVGCSRSRLNSTVYALSIRYSQVGREEHSDSPTGAATQRITQWLRLAASYSPG